MFTSLDEEVDGQEKITFGDNSKGKVKGLGKVAISHGFIWTDNIQEFGRKSLLSCDCG